MEIRDARTADIAALAHATASQPLLGRYGVTEAGLARDLQRGLDAGEGLLVCVEGVGPVGFASYQLRGGLGVGGYLKLIALAPGHESGGRGQALLDEVERRVSVASAHLFLLVSDFNQSAMRFYERAGYVQRGALPGFVKPDITEYLYWKRLR